MIRNMIIFSVKVNKYIIQIKFLIKKGTMTKNEAKYFDIESFSLDII